MNRVVPIRIKEARISREMSLEDLSKELLISRQSLSKYELGSVQIDEEQIINISKILNYPIDFFYKEKNEFCSNSIVHFRSTTIPQKTKKMFEQRVFIFDEYIVRTLKDYIEFPKLNLIDVNAFNLDNEEEFDKIEEIALELRKFWNLGLEPIMNLTNILLKNGIIISNLDLNNIKVDGFSTWISGVPYIFVGSDKKSAVRMRFSLAHELGHIILHSHITEEEAKRNHKRIEAEANRFASAFLMPQSTFLEDIFSLNLDSFISIKRKWKVSIGAIIRRLYDLEMITEQQYSNLNRYINLKSWRKNEPLDDVIPLEKPKLLKEAFEILIQNDVLDMEKILQDIPLLPEEIEEYCFIEERYFDRNKLITMKPILKLIK